MNRRCVPVCAVWCRVFCVVCMIDHSPPSVVPIDHRQCYAAVLQVQDVGFESKSSTPAGSLVHTGATDVRSAGSVAAAPAAATGGPHDRDAGNTVGSAITTTLTPAARMRGDTPRTRRWCDASYHLFIIDRCGALRQAQSVCGSGVLGFRVYAEGVACLRACVFTSGTLRFRIAHGERLCVCARVICQLQRSVPATV